MIRESQMRLRRHLRHMAADAILNGDVQLGMRLCVVAARTAAVVIRAVVLQQRLMRVVAGEAGKLPLAFEEAGALGQIERLVADVPGIVPVGCAAGWSRLAVT